MRAPTRSSCSEFSGAELELAGGAVGLRAADGTLLDAVGWGTGTASNPLVEGTAAPAPPARQSLARVPNGEDTDDNAYDLVRRLGPTPGAMNL